MLLILRGGDFAVRYISGKATIKDFVAVFLATRDISEFFDRFLPIISKDISKDDKAKEMLNLVNEYDTFVMVVL
jgi:2-hydroxy-3-keto-5-methylthiopentenyl-1-phosphate phosphatase